MPFTIVMPKWGLSMEQGLISQWLKNEGDQVEQGQPVLEVETEKITNLVEAPATGTLGRILYPAGTTIAVGEPIAIILAPGEELSAVALPGAAGTAAEASQAAATIATLPATPTVATARAIIPATPAARRLAREHAIDLAALSGSGLDGMITREDVERAATARAMPASQPIQKVSFFSEGHRLDGILYTPAGLAPGEQRAAVVLCVGYTYLKSLVVPDLAKALTAAGYVALIFDYRGFGESEGPRWRLIPHEQVQDIRAALTFLADQPQVLRDRLAVAGISLGAANAIVAAALDQRISAVAAIQPFGDGERWLRCLRRHWEWREFQQRIALDRSRRVRTGTSTRVDPLEIILPDPASQAFLEQVYTEFPQMRCDLPLETAEALVEYSPEQLVGRLAPRPLLIIHGAEDRLIPTAEVHSLYAHAGEPRRLALIEAMDHFNWVIPGSPGFRQVVDRWLAFLQEVVPAQ